MTPLFFNKIERFGVVMACSAAIVAPFVLFLALPPFFNGFWVQVEGAMPVLHGVAALGSLGCAVAAGAGSDRARAALTHPLVMIPAALTSVAIVTLPVVTVPALSLLGAPEHGFGALAYLDLAALTACALIAAGGRISRQTMLASAALTVIAAFTLDLLFRVERTWAPFYFPDYLAFYAVFSVAMLAAFRVARRKLWLAAFALLGLLAALSGNRALALAGVSAGVVVAVLSRSISHRTLVLLCATAPLVVSAAILAIGMPWREEIRDALQGVFGSSAGNAISALWTSLWSRAMLVVVAGYEFLDAPARALTGIGWGHYNEILLANLSQVRSQHYEFIGQARSYWDALQRSDFHSHNQYVEALLSGGVISFALSLAYGAAVVALAAPHVRLYATFVVLTLVGLQCLWFQMPHTLPVMAIAVAVLVTESAPIRRFGSFAAPVAACAAALLIGAGVAAWTASTNARAALSHIRAEDGVLGSVDFGFSAGLREIYQAALLQSAYAKFKGGLWDDPRTRLRRMSAVRQLLASLPDDGRTVRLRVSEINVLSGLAFTLPEYEEQFGSLDAALGRAVARLLERAPKRTDLVIPYLDRLLVFDRERDVLALAESILRNNQNDPVALWFSGIVLMGEPRSAEEGMRRLKLSLSYRIEDQMPIPAEISEQIQSAH